MERASVEGVDAYVEFSFGDDERRGNNEVADPCLLGDAHRHHLCRDLIDHQGLALYLVAHGVEGLFRVAVLDDLDGPEKPQAAHVAYRRMLFLEGFELFAT